MAWTNKKVLFKTPLQTTSGYGRDGIFLSESLMHRSVDLHLDPTQVSIPLPETITHLFHKPRPPFDARAEHNGFDIGICHVWPQEIEWYPRLPQYCDKLIAWSMWEFNGMGGNDTNFKKRLDLFDLVLAYDATTAEAFAPYVEDPDRLRVLQGGYNSEWWTPKDGDPVRDWDAETFVFVMNGTMNKRKAPWTAIQAFNILKLEYGDAFNAEMHMKTYGSNLPPGVANSIPGLKVIVEAWNDTQIRHFYQRAHCLISCSWGEGKNLPALEAQTCGMPVLVSACGGHLEWAREDWAYLIGGTMGEHSPGMASLRVDPYELAEKMWHIYNNRSEAKQKGELASRVIPQMCDWDRVLERLDLIIEETEAKPRDPDA
jgi:glycosyltransferase involved in cell wall biosynthesis